MQQNCFESDFQGTPICDSCSKKKIKNVSSPNCPECGHNVWETMPSKALFPNIVKPMGYVRENSEASGAVWLIPNALEQKNSAFKKN